MRIIIKDRRQLPSAARKILDFSGGKRIFAMHGTLGAGKTTLIKAICKVLGAEDNITSPSFTLVNEYLTVDGKALYHIDFYRIKKPDELFDIGIEEYLSSGSYCFLEWPELAGDFIPSDVLHIAIAVGKNEERILNIS